jgi:hypothetical protein
MAGFSLRGALIEFTETFPLPVPNVIAFQYNPETMAHAWTPASTSANSAHASGNPLAISGQPQESFTFTLLMDSSQTLADGGAVSAGQALATGVYARLAALEMLLFPTAPKGGGLIGTVSSALGITGKPPRSVPAASLPVVFFVWGPGRIVPVRVSDLSITEKLYDSDLLNPTHVEAQITLRVLTHDELKYVKGTIGKVARGAYIYSQKLRESLALANIENDAASIIGMLPI